MTGSDDIFRYDYDLDAAQPVRPQGHDFEMLVTPRFRAHYVQRSYEPLTSSLIRAVAGRKRVFLDVGAHYGFFSIVAGLRNPALEIHAIEPLEENCEILQRNLQLNGISSAVCHRAAASNETGTATLCRSRASDNSSFYPHPQAPPLAEIEVPTLELGSLLEDRTVDPILIKIDTDGHEIAILQGLADSLAGNDDVTIVVELNPKMQRRAGHSPGDLLRQLEGMGFSSFLVQEERTRLLEVDSSSDWDELIPARGTANLYCRPRSSSLSICFMAHSHALAGAERAMADLVTQLIEDHGTVCNVVIPGDGPLRERILRAGAGVIPADYGWWSSAEARPEDEIREALGDDLVRLMARTVPEIAATQPDVISTGSMVIPHGAIVAAILGKPHVWHLREYGSRAEGHHFYLPDEQLTEFIEDHSEIIFTASRRLGQNRYSHLPDSRIEHLYPAIQAPAPPQEGTAERDSSDSKPMLLIDLASIFEAKQQEIDVRAVAELTRRGHDVELLLKGPQDPDYVTRLRQIAQDLGIADRVRIESFSDDIWATLYGADVVMISAPRHCFGRVAAEGMLAGKPVIYPQTTDISEYMEEGVTGLSYRAGDAVDMAEKVERLIQNPALAEGIGRAATEAANRLFTRAGFGDKFLARARQLKGCEVNSRPPLPSLFLDSLVLGIQRLDHHSNRLADLVRSREEEIVAAKETLEAQQTEISNLAAVLEARDEELDSIKPVLKAKQEELDSIKPVLVARDEELTNVKDELARVREKSDRILSTRLGRLAAKLAETD